MGDRWHKNDAVISAPEFLARNYGRLPQVCSGNPRVVALHQHGQDDEDLKNIKAVKQILSQLEGIRLVDGGELEGWSYHCGSNAESPSKTFSQSLNASIAQLDRVADTIVTIYHSCHRAVTKSVQPYGLSCRNYVDLIAERTGFQSPDRYGYFVEVNDEDKIWQDVANRFSSQEESRGRQVIRDYLLPSTCTTAF